MPVRREKGVVGVRWGGRNPMAKFYGCVAEDGCKGLPTTKGAGEAGVVDFSCGVHVGVG
jgi:hypothetical protein